MTKVLIALNPATTAEKLRAAAAELRQGRIIDLALAQRLERRAEAILRPHLPRWWTEEMFSDTHAPRRQGGGTRP
jgi:hypothetical protein